jgi:hypothetical protein
LGNIENAITNNISVIPNPFTYATTLESIENLKDATLTIYNSYGQIVKQINTISGKSVTVLRDNLPSGLYFISLTEENKTIAVENLIITD